MPQTVELVRVKTTLGDRVYPLDTRVYSNVGGKDLFFREYAGDLKGDEMILWHNESIDTTLQEVEPHLQQSPRYQKAEQTVYATNSHGQKVPQFRIQLIRALAAKGIVTAESPQNLEQKIMREQDKEFTTPEYGAMARFLYQEIQRIGQEDNAPTRAQDTIEDWLTGKTLGPQDSNVFYSLALATGSPTFDQWLMGAKDTATSSTGFWGEYKFYTVLRQTIMRYLAKSKGELKQKTAEIGDTTAAKNGHGNGKKESLDMTPEIQIVLHQFMEEINEEFSLARVLGVEKAHISINEYRQQKTIPLPHLAKGAYTSEAKEGMATLSLDTILSEAVFFGNVLHYVFQNYFEGCITGKYAAPEAAAGVIDDARHLITPQGHPLVEKAFAGSVVVELGKKLGLIRPRIRRPPWISAWGNPEELINVHGFIFNPHDASGQVLYPRIRESVAGTLSEWIMTGTLDTALGLEPMTVYRTLQHSAKLHSSIPNSYRDMKSAQNELLNILLDRQARRQLAHDYRKLERRVNRYGLGATLPKALLAPFMEEIYATSMLERLQEIKPAQLNSDEAKIFGVSNLLNALLEKSKPSFDLLHNASYLKRTAEVNSGLLQDRGARFLTKTECLAILERHGLPELMHFIPEANFVLDQKPEAVNATAESGELEAKMEEAANPTVAAGGAA